MSVRWKDKADITTLAAGDRIPVTDVSDANVDKYTTPAEIATYVSANLTDDIVTNADLAEMAQSRIKGRAEGAGTGNPTDLTPAEVREVAELASTDSPTFVNLTQTGYHDLTEIAAPASPAANVARLYARDVSSRTELAFKNSSGHVIDLLRGFISVKDYGAAGDNSTDDTTAIQAAINAAAVSVGGLQGAYVFFPKGQYVVSDTIEFPVTHFTNGVTLVGEGRWQSKIRLSTALGAGEAVFHRADTGATVHGGGFVNIQVDANYLADYAVHIEVGKGGLYEGAGFFNALVTEALFGDAVTARWYENKLIDCWFRNENPTAADRSDYNCRLLGFATDNEFIRCTFTNAINANFYTQAASNALTCCHAYGSPSTYEATYCFQADGGTRFIDNYADGFGTAGFYLNSNDNAVIGSRILWPATTTGDGILIATGRSGLAVMGNTYVSKPAARSKVAFAGTVPTDSQILDGFASASGQSLFLGHTQNISGGSNARLQVVGTDFATSLQKLARFSADSSSPTLSLQKSRNADPTAFTIVQVSDVLGIVEFAGDDGATVRTAAAIRGTVDGTPGSSDMPGRLGFFTTPDGSATALERLRVNNAGAITALAPLGGIGYGTGAGGAVTQVTNKTTSVTLNTVCGQVTMEATTAIGAGANATFTLTNSAIATTDVVVCCIDSGGTANAYTAQCVAVGAGSCAIKVTNTTAGSLSEAPVINFAVIKAVAA